MQKAPAPPSTPRTLMQLGREERIAMERAHIAEIARKFDKVADVEKAIQESGGEVDLAKPPTIEQVKLITEQFKHLDIDNRGGLDREAFDQVPGVRNLSAAIRGSLFRGFDRDGNGVVRPLANSRKCTSRSMTAVLTSPPTLAVPTSCYFCTTLIGS